ncbi:MAG: PAS domain S-box protein, partial [Anaerolineae bacterium]|nr:PAS domain S-box protein [Anaerolineae bacterium]
QRRQVEGVEHGIRALNGETKWLSVNAAPLLDEHGQLHGAVASFRDVTERKLAEERQGRMAAVVQMSPDAIVIVDVAGKIIYANSAMARMCGLNAQADVIGTNAVDWFASPDEARAISQETLEKGSLGHWECQGLDKQGRRIPVEISTTVMRNNLGEITGFAAIIRDITARKRVENALRESEYKLRSIIERSPSSIVLCDERGVIIKWNAAQERVSGMGQEEALGRLMWDVAFQMAPQERRTPQAFERIRAMMQSLLSDGQAPWPRQAHEQVIQRPDGTRCVVETHVFPIETDKGFMLCSITHDVTARVQTEKKLERYAAELKRSNRDLGQFASVISHDLREPLRMVSSYLELLERRYRAALDEQALAYIAYAADGAGRMHEMIQALLRLAQVETHGGAFTPTDLETTLVRVCQALERAIEEAGAEVTHDALPTVMADEAQLAQVLQNLIANGIKFCRADAPPRVHVSARQEDDEWLFSVADNGIGIDPQQGGRIFEIFQRLHTREEYEGAGIGLALCQRIVERHGGRIWVESEPGAGSTFYFTLPCAD